MSKESASGLPRAVILRGAAELVALRALVPPGSALLLSAPGAAGFLGPRPWRAMVAAAPGFADALCCGDAAGDALAALRAGCRRLVLDNACPGYHMVEGAAAEIGAILLPARPPALDLAGLDLRRADAFAKLNAWLAGSNTPAA
ncbi:MULTISPECIES: hypothetical protein [Roseomonadaceae]|uniref:Uncharacterized protein n=1 Tax=Falsiroseomonas oleicola TaxID=2801474 RepID=A0ABS6HBS6_9PROT|nr:hypothetical protein [Roseomonas oleicola]MBU8544931.1 hypothetical protein [Roseomonas oleicola]